MPRLPKPQATTRLNLQLTTQVRERLESLQEKTEADSLTEVIRRALAVYEFLLHEKAAGNRVLIDRDGELVEVALM